MWRYREMLPLFPGEAPITLGEGFTPLLRTCRLGDAVGLDRLYVKDEAFNPTNSFKARGQSAAMTRAKAWAPRRSRCPRPATPATPWRRMRRAADIRCEIFMPRDAKQPFLDECALYGAHVTLVDGLITDAGKMAGEKARELGWYDLSTLKEPYRAEGKKTMGYELGGAARVGAARLDHLSHRRRHRHGRHVEGLRRDGGARLDRAEAAEDGDGATDWLRADRPRLRAGHRAGAVWENPATEAHGLRVPKAIGDFLVLRAIRESGGTALAVTDRQMVDDMLLIGRLEGISAAPEGAAALSAARMLLESGRLRRDESVVLFNTGGALKYLEVLRSVR